MATKVLFHCEKGHDLTFWLGGQTHSISIVRKWEGDIQPTSLHCRDFKKAALNKRIDCLVCDNCVATEVHDDN